MKKKGLVNLLSARTGVSRTECSTIIDALPDAMADALISDGEFNLREFATFKVSELSERMGYNPNTGELEKRPPKKKVNCKFSKKIIDELNK